MCGIFGFSGKKGQKVDLLKIQLLGAYNTERGKDSCGYYYNGNIQKGCNLGNKLEADFKEFVSNNGIHSGNLDSEIFMGHTRKGKNATIYNAHPVELNLIIITHNGTIENINDLAKEAKITEYFSIDTKGLGMIIEKDGLRVLDKYVGSAALAINWKSDPNAVYLYRGASKDKKDDKYMWHEKPLFTLVQPEGLYYSSSESSLKAISSDGTQPVPIISNTVFRISNGEFTDWEFKINREFTNVKEEKKVASCAIGGNSGGSIVMDPNKEDKIKTDLLPVEVNRTNVVYCRFGRYYTGNKLLNGIFKITKNGVILTPNVVTPDASVYYFVRGIMMRTYHDYNKAKNMDINIELNVADLLSNYSKYPVFCLEEEGTLAQEKFKNKWYLDGKIITSHQSFQPKFSKKKYFIKGGKTVTIMNQ